MTHFEELLANDPDFNKKRKELADRLFKERKDLKEQLKNAKMGKPHLSLTLDKKVQNTRKLEEKLIKESNKRQNQIKERYKELKFEKAKKLSVHDKEGYEKWLQKQRMLAKRDLMRHVSKTITKDKNKPHERDR